MKIHEYQAKELFRKFNVPTPKGKLALTSDEVAKIAKIAASPETKTAIQKNMDVVDRDIRAQALPTVIANGRRTSGLQTK